MKTYEIEMTTTLVIPDGNEKIDLVKVFHALPTLREWSPPEAMFDATNLKFSPDSGEELSNDETESRYLRWVVGGIQRPGTKYVFTSSMEVASPDRTLLVKAVKTKWGDYDVPPEDKNAVVDQEVAQTLHPKLVKVAAKFKAELPPARAVLAMCKYIVDNYKYDASVSFSTSDVKNIVKEKRGHCGHQAALFRHLTAAVGIPARSVAGMNLYAPDGRTSALQKIHSDWTNIHTWAEVYFPSVGWVEVDPALGADAFSIPSHKIQNNAWFQNYTIWLRESGEFKQPTWTPVSGGFRSDYGVEHIISFTIKK